jgi:hypothetical protein
MVKAVLNQSGKIKRPTGTPDITCNPSNQQMPTAPWPTTISGSTQLWPPADTPEHLTAKGPMHHQINLNLSQIHGEHQNGTRKETCSNQSPQNTRVSSELILKLIQNSVKKDVCSPLV